MTKRFVSFFLIILLAMPFFLKAEESYTANISRNIVRGTTNALTSPLEIPVTAAKLRNSQPNAVASWSRGIADGIVRMVERFGSGGWDFFVMLFPSDQQGVPPTPEMLPYKT